MKRFAISVLILCFLHLISSKIVELSVPYHRQFNGYTCGCASFAMVYHFHTQGKFNLDQRSIASVMRTSNYTGSLSYDTQRVAHFSVQSSTPAQIVELFPNQAPKNGWFSLMKDPPFNVPNYGMASFWRRDANQCWIEELAPLITETQIPVLLLMNYQGTKGGHFRVLTGVETDDASGAIKNLILQDPWDRDGDQRRVVYDRETFCLLWSHREPNSGIKTVMNAKSTQNTSPKVYFDPYFAMAAQYWQVQLQKEMIVDPSPFVSQKNGNLIRLHVQVTYPIWPAFASQPHNLQLEAAPVLYIIQHPLNMQILRNASNANWEYRGEEKSGKNQRQKTIFAYKGSDAWQPGFSTTAQWLVWINDIDYTNTTDYQVQSEQKITFFVTGLIKNSVPATQYKEPDVYNPGYDYMDWIGGSSEISC